MKERFNIADRFFSIAENFPGKVAIISDDRRITFSELAESARSASQGFISRGIKKGDRVLVLIPMGPELYSALLALFNIGATAVLIEEWVGIKKISACVSSADCHALVGGAKARAISFFVPALRRIKNKISLRALQKETGIPAPADTSQQDTALITFTTGSTGEPKAAKRTHGFLNEQFLALKEMTEAYPGETDMPAFPVVLLLNLGVGCTSVIPDFKLSKPGSLKPEKIFAQLSRNQVNRLECSPFFAARLAEHMISGELKLPSLAKLFTGGAPVFPAIAAKLQKAFPGTAINAIYGSTEAEPISSVGAPEIRTDSGRSPAGLSAGRPFHRIEVRIIRMSDDPIHCPTENDLGQLRLPDGEVGEIIVSGPHVLREYHNSGDAMKRNKIITGSKCWHRTGDSGYMRDGILYLTGRCASLIRNGNTIISPFLFENTVIEMGLKCGTLVKISDEQIAVVETAGTNSIQELEAAFRARGFEFDRLVVMPVPRDRRHFSRIDQFALRKSLKRRLT